MTHDIQPMERTVRPWHKLERCPGSGKEYAGAPKMTDKYHAIPRWQGKCPECKRWTMADTARGVVTFHLRKLT